MIHRYFASTIGRRRRDCRCRSRAWPGRVGFALVLLVLVVRRACSACYRHLLLAPIVTATWWRTHLFALPLWLWLSKGARDRWTVPALAGNRSWRKPCTLAGLDWRWRRSVVQVAPAGPAATMRWPRRPNARTSDPPPTTKTHSYLARAHINYAGGLASCALLSIHASRRRRGGRDAAAARGVFAIAVWGRATLGGVRRAGGTCCAGFTGFSWCCAPSRWAGGAQRRRRAARGPVPRTGNPVVADFHQG